MAKYQGLSLNISPILLCLSQTGSCSVRLFGQGQAAGRRGVCATSPCCLGVTHHQFLHLGVLLHWVNTSAVLGKFGATCKWMQSEAFAGFRGLQSARMRLMLET